MAKTEIFLCKEKKKCTRQLCLDIGILAVIDFSTAVSSRFSCGFNESTDAFSRRRCAKGEVHVFEPGYFKRVANQRNLCGYVVVVVVGGCCCACFPPETPPWSPSVCAITGSFTSADLTSSLGSHHGFPCKNSVKFVSTKCQVDLYY